MCGIVASITPPNVESCRWIRPGTETLEHRGPDGSGVSSVDLGWCRVHLGMPRLKIVDQSDLSLPFTFPHLDVSLAYNGEIYNWRELRASLPDVSWRTKCDAEVLAAAWRRWGLDSLDRMNGMWGFVLVDHQTRSVLIARDRAGEKPVYWAASSGHIYVASEIKALPVALNPIYCPSVEALDFDCLEDTPFANVHALPPGHYIKLSGGSGAMAVRHGEVLSAQWWSLPEPPFAVPADDYDAEVEALTEEVVDAVAIRARADVPVGIMLSGGLDSAIIQRVARCTSGYCVTFPEIDNLSRARLAIADGQPERLRTVTFGYPDLMEVINKVAYHLDTPGTWTAVCQWFLFQTAAGDGMRVMLSGEGADELAAGYTRYRILYWLQQMHVDRQLESYKPLVEYVLGDMSEVLVTMLDRGETDASRGYCEYLLHLFSHRGMDLVTRMSRVDFYTTMQVLLRMADRMAAAFSIENRSPFLDYRVIERLARMPMAWKITAQESKHVLRDVARRVGVAPGIVDEVGKRGLAIPWASWHGAGRSSRGPWGRESFKSLMSSAWARSCCRLSRCGSCREVRMFQAAGKVARQQDPGV